MHLVSVNIVSTHQKLQGKSVGTELHRDFAGRNESYSRVNYDLLVWSSILEHAIRLCWWTQVGAGQSSLRHAGHQNIGTSTEKSFIYTFSGMRKESRDLWSSGYDSGL